MPVNLSDLSREVLSLARAQLLVNLRFLDRALFELELKESAEYPLATDGFRLHYHPAHLMIGYRDQRTYVARGYLHALLHCIFQHMFIAPSINRPLWDLACDMAVQAIMDELNLPDLVSETDQRCKAVVEQLRGAVRPLTAEKIYRWLQDTPLDQPMLEMWRKLFAVDHHDPWYIFIEAEGGQSSSPLADSGADGNDHSGSGSGRSSGNPDNGSGNGDADSNGGNNTEGNSDGSANPGRGPARSREQQQQLWQDVAERMQTDLETFSKDRGDQAGSLLQSLRALNREKVDYAAFLRKFAAQCEVMKLSPDEFDYVYYTYGMSLYEDMPLIEPLEYRDDKRIRDFVIAIDTSGSVRGEIVQQFLQKTYNILMQEETFARRFNLHIIQCDADIQEDVVIHTREEFEQYLSTMTLRGFGGTDFRPVFTCIEQLRRDKAFRDLRGMLYFTDGYGAYPAKPTDYKTAFVFLAEDDYNMKDVPPWAIRVVMDQETIQVHE